MTPSGTNSPRWWNNNLLISILTVVFIGLTTLCGHLLDTLRPVPILLGVLLVVVCMCVYATLRAVAALDKSSKAFSEHQEESNELEAIKRKLEPLREQLLNVSWLQRKEDFQDFEASNETTEVWVLTFDFQYETGDFKDIVAENLRRDEPVRYVYIYPKAARSKVHVLRAMLQDRGISPGTIARHVQLYELVDAVVPLNEAIYNPKSATGRTRAIMMTPEVEFSYYVELNADQTGRMIEKFEQLKRDIPPTKLTDFFSETAP